MSTPTAADLCRVSVVAGGRRLDVAVPANVPVAHLLPALLARFGGGSPDTEPKTEPDTDPASAGWALQRLAEAPLDTSQTMAALGVRHGEVLYLREPDSLLPVSTVDDPVDAVAAAINDMPARWSPRAARRCALAAVAVTLAAGAILLAFAGPPWPPVTLLAALLAFALMVAGPAVSRAGGVGDAAVVLALSAVPYAFVAGLTASAGMQSAPRLGPAALLLACAAVLLVAGLGAVLLPSEVALFAATGFGAGLGLVGAVLGLVLPTAPGAAAVAGVLALLVGPLIPMTAFRLARLPMPVVPDGRADLAGDGATASGSDIVRRTATADRMVTGLLAGSCVAAIAASVVLVRVPGWGGPTQAAATAVALLLRGRHYGGLAQRVWLLAGGLACGVLAAVAVAAGGAAGTRLGMAVLLVAVGAAAGVAGLAVRRLPPHLGRLADLLEGVAIVSVLPAYLQVIGVFAQARRLGG